MEVGWLTIEGAAAVFAVSGWSKIRMGGPVPGPQRPQEQARKPRGARDPPVEAGRSLLEMRLPQLEVIPPFLEAQLPRPTGGVAWQSSPGLHHVRPPGREPETAARGITSVGFRASHPDPFRCELSRFVLSCPQLS
jgi:hypothetical protein